MAPQRLLLLLFLFGDRSFVCQISPVMAALATNDVHLPDEQGPQNRPYQHQLLHPPKDLPMEGKTMYPVAPTAIVTRYIEHEQTERAARQYVAEMNDSELDQLPAWCKPCNATLLHYCRSYKFLNDHCCCEYSHTKEQLPWIPHTCMRQLEERCTANAGSCSKYRAIKECCCDRLTKREYKSKFSTASAIPGGIAFWQLLLVVLVCHLQLPAVRLHTLTSGS